MILFPILFGKEVVDREVVAVVFGSSMCVGKHLAPEWADIKELLCLDGKIINIFHMHNTIKKQEFVSGDI